MELVDDIRAKVAGGAFEYSQHALDQSIQRHISVNELREAIASCEVIEDYRNDKYGPSCLVLGFTAAGRPLHIQCSHPTRSLVKIITLYEPDPELWEERTTGAGGPDMAVTQPHEEFLEQEVTYFAEVEGRFVVIERVPARVSLLTGEKLYTPETVERIQAIVWGQVPPTRTVLAPVYEFSGSDA